MFTYQGIAMDASAVIDEECPMSFAVCDDQVEFEFGHRTGMLSMIFSEEALERLVPIVAEALAELRAGDEDAPGPG
jgi:hypothetical protein